MIPGEYFLSTDAIEINAGRPTRRLDVTNRGDRPVQVGSHCHFFEVNRFLDFDREAAYGMRLNIAAGTAVRFAFLSYAHTGGKGRTTSFRAVRTLTI